MPAIPGSRKDLRLHPSVNYFGTISIIKGAYDLLKQKNGACVISASSAISREDMKTDLVDLLNNNRDDEYRILEVIGRMDGADLNTGDQIYAAPSMHSAAGCAATLLLCRQRVRINAVSWNVNTPMTATGSKDTAAALNALPIPTKYGTKKQMDPEEIASVITFLISPEPEASTGSSCLWTVAQMRC